MIYIANFAFYVYRQRKELAIPTKPIVNENSEIVLQYTMNGFWFGILIADNNRCIKYVDDKNALLCLLSDNLLSVLEDNCFRYICIQSLQICHNTVTVGCILC